MERANALLKARRETGYLENFPTPFAQTLDEAYAIQDQTIAQWPTKLVGWKVGRINGDDIDKYGTDRLAGPIFEPTLHKANLSVLDMPVYGDGFAAVEGECVAIIGADTDPEKTDYTTEEALTLIQSMHAGIEIASSPFPGINDNGPLVTISDFGNNYGLIIGEEIPNWKDLKLENWTFATYIDGELIGEKTPDSIPGGPVESVRFLLENAARRGFPLKAGDAITTGAVTGVHAIKVGQTSRVTCAGTADMTCRITALEF